MAGDSGDYTLNYLGKELLIQDSTPCYYDGIYIIRDSNTGVFYFIGTDESQNPVVKKYNPVSNTIDIMGTISMEGDYKGLLLNSDSSKLYVIVEYEYEIGVSISILEYDIETWTEIATDLPDFGYRIRTNILLDNNGFIWFCMSVNGDYVIRRFDTNTNTTIDTSLNLPYYTYPTGVAVKDGFVSILTQTESMSW